jgi:hypothetical protein
LWVRRRAPVGCVAEPAFDLVAQEDPATTELVSRQDSAPREVERGRDREVQELSDLAGVEDVIASEAWAA